MGFWMWLYRRPAENPRVNAAELAYVNQDDAEDAAAAKAAAAAAAEGPRIGYLKAFSLRQTWSLVLGRFFTDGVWWFFLFWTPSYLSDQFGYTSDSGMGMALIFTLYAIVTFVSIYLCKLPTYMVDRRGMNPYDSFPQKNGRSRLNSIWSTYPMVAPAYRFGPIALEPNPPA
jgi:ACS family hexuronate transporter-like MFS transporter